MYNDVFNNTITDYIIYGSVWQRHGRFSSVGERNKKIKVFYGIKSRIFCSNLNIDFPFFLSARITKLPFIFLAWESNKLKVI